MKKCLKGDERELEDYRETMMHERLNVTLNIFEEDKNDNVVPWQKKHKLHMRTINEGPVRLFFFCFCLCASLPMVLWVLY